VAGHVGLEFRNVGANYIFERSYGFPGIYQILAGGDYSRLSCGVEDNWLIELHRSYRDMSRPRTRRPALIEVITVNDEHPFPKGNRRTYWQILAVG
jgi:hypothetical protein